MEEIIINQEATAAVIVSKGIVVSFAPPKRRSGISGIPGPDIPLKINNSDIALGYVARWGLDNLFPQNVLAAIRSNTIVGTALDWKVRALYSGGLCYGELEYDKDGNEKFIRVIDSVVQDFFRKSSITNYMVNVINDFYYFYNSFPEFTLSLDRSKIVQLSAQKSTYSRYSLQDQNTGRVEWCFINANWEHFASATDPRTLVRPVLDMYYDPVGSLQNRNDGFNYIYPMSYPSAGETYYQLAPWNSVLTSGWLDAANSIAQFKKYLMENQISVKYHIKVSEDYWRWKYKNWDSLSQKERNVILDTEMKAFNDFVTGANNAGRSIMTNFRFDPVTKTAYPGWEIIAVDDKIKSGIYIEDSQEASSHLLYALGVDATLIGSAPGKGMGAGSGSDKREAFNMYLSLCKVHEDIILDPLNFIRDYNGWNPNLVFRFNRPYLQTLNQVPPSQRNTIIPDNGGQSNS